MKEDNFVSIAVGDRSIPIRVIGRWPPSRSAFFLGIAKSGSTLLHMMVEDICNSKGAYLLNVSDSCFAAGIPERQIPKEIVPSMVDEVTAYFYGFRCIGRLATSASFRTCTKIMLIRDPRDALTSLYYSVLKSHSVPKEGKTANIISGQRRIAERSDINAFITDGNGDFILTALNEAANLCWLPNFHIHRYEDVIFNKREWIRDIDSVVGFDLTESDIDRLLARHDVKPESENPERHIRQVTPGNYMNHLNEESLRYIANKCKMAMNVFGYN